jgi:hypothetical protein
MALPPLPHYQPRKRRRQYGKPTIFILGLIRLGRCSTSHSIGAVIPNLMLASLGRLPFVAIGGGLKVEQMEAEWNEALHVSNIFFGSIRIARCV